VPPPTRRFPLPHSKASASRTGRAMERQFGFLSFGQAAAALFGPAGSDDTCADG